MCTVVVTLSASRAGQLAVGRLSLPASLTFLIVSLDNR